MRFSLDRQRSKPLLKLMTSAFLQGASAFLRLVGFLCLLRYHSFFLWVFRLPLFAKD